MRLLSILLLSGSLSLLAAQGTSPVAPAKVAPPATASVDKVMEGMLVSVDIAKQVLVINLRGKEYSFTVDKAASISINNAASTLDKVTAGNGIRVTYARSGNGDRVVKTLMQTIAAKKVTKVAPAPAPAVAAKPVAAPAPAPAVAAKPAVAPAPAPAVAAKPAVAPAPAPAAAAKPAVAPAPAPVVEAKPAAAPAPAPAVAATPVAAPAPAPAVAAKPVAAPAPAPAPSPVAPKAAPATK